MNQLPLRTLALAVSLATAQLAYAADTTSTDNQDDTAKSGVELGATNVSATGSVAGQSTTEGTGSYTTGRMNTATKLPMSIRETPQQVTVVTRQQIEDQGMTDLNDVVKNTTGLTVQKYGPERVQYVSRGFVVDNLMYDGLPTSISTYTQDVITAADSAMFDRVEVVRGATGLMQGAGNPAAAINMVRKKPTAETQASITTGAGSWDRYRTEVDVSGPLNQEGTVRGRVVGAYQDGNSFQDNVSRERGFYYGVLDADLNDATTLTLGASYQNDNKNSNWVGLPTNADGSNPHLPRSTNSGPDWAYWNTDVTAAFANLEHRFDNGWKLNLAMNKMWARIHMIGTYSSTGGGNYIYTDDHSSYDAYASGPFQLFGREHELVVGTSYREEMFDGHGGWADVVDGARPAFDRTLWNMRTTNTQTGTYVTTRWNLADDLKLITGARLDWYETRDDLTGESEKAVRHVTRYAGLVYDINDTYSAYASFTDIFKPQNVQDEHQNFPKPIVGKNYEMGVKGEFFGGALNAGAAVFLVDQENRSVAEVYGDRDGDGDLDICPGTASSLTCNRASGKVRSTGIDLDISGAITPNWQASAGYTYAHVVYQKDEENQGNRFNPEMPQHLFKVSTNYHFQGPLEKLRVGGTVTAQTGTYAESNTNLQQAGYTLVDLMLGYKVNEHIDTRVNFNNVFDRTYFSGINFGTLEYGDPRNVMFSVKWSL